MHSARRTKRKRGLQRKSRKNTATAVHRKVQQGSRSHGEQTRKTYLECKGLQNDPGGFKEEE